MVSIYEERRMIKKAQNVLLKQIRSKFGELPEQVEAKIRSILDEELLDTLLERILTADSLSDMKLEEA